MNEIASERNSSSIQNQNQLISFLIFVFFMTCIVALILIRPDKINNYDSKNVNVSLYAETKPISVVKDDVSDKQNQEDKMILDFFKDDLSKLEEDKNLKISEIREISNHAVGISNQYQEAINNKINSTALNEVAKIHEKVIENLTKKQKELAEINDKIESFVSDKKKVIANESGDSKILSNDFNEHIQKSDLDVIGAKIQEAKSEEINVLKDINNLKYAKLALQEEISQLEKVKAKIKIETEAYLQEQAQIKQKTENMSKEAEQLSYAISELNNLRANFSSKITPVESTDNTMVKTQSPGKIKIDDFDRTNKEKMENGLWSNFSSKK